MAVPLTANLAVEEITNRPNPESRNARKQQPTTGFLAKSNTCSGQITAMVQSLPNSSRATSYGWPKRGTKPPKGDVLPERPHDAKSSSNALAAFRSRVPKPSVNQL